MSERQTIVTGRPVTHPGPSSKSRTSVRVGTTRPHPASDLSGGDAGSASTSGDGDRRLIDLVVEAVEATGATSGIVEFQSVALSRISYCFPAAGDAAHPMLYSRTHESTGVVLNGTATVGYRREDPEAGHTRWVHFHAAWTDANGILRGGHLWPETTASTPLANATVWPLHGMDLVNATDPETELPVFSPVPIGDADSPEDTTGPEHLTSATALTAGDRRVVFARVCPNEEISQVIARLTDEHDLHGGSVCGGTGSLVGATFTDERIVEGPATEIISLSGRLPSRPAADGPDSSPLVLSCVLIDANAEVHGGVLAPTGNLVGATYDLVLAGPQRAAAEV